MMRTLLLATILALLPEFGSAASCTKGVDCYCDRVQGGDLNDTALLVCEDWEAPTLVNDQGVGNGAPYYGPWYDETGGGFTCFRGFNSYFRQVWSDMNAGGGGDHWPEGQPSSPTLGCTCDTGGAGTCNAGAWDATNRWQAVTGTGIAMMRDSDYNVEVPSITPPSGRAGGGSGSFDGAVSFAHRVKGGFPNTTDIHSGRSLGGTRRTFGITMAIAYASNVVASNIFFIAWKHNEWGDQADSLFVMYNHPSGATQTTPFDKHALLYQQAGFGNETQSGCQTKLNAATQTLGVFECSDVAFYYAADPSVYDQAVDWSFGTWGCARGHFENMGLTNSRIRIWFGSATVAEKLILDISNLDTSAMAASGGYNQLQLNSYANANNNDGSGLEPSGTAETTFRYEDNMHIRTGAPVSCAQIGFGGEAGPPPTYLPIRISEAVNDDFFAMAANGTP